MAEWWDMGLYAALLAAAVHCQEALAVITSEDCGNERLSLLQLSTSAAY